MAVEPAASGAAASGPTTGPAVGKGLQTTATLLGRLRAGDEAARDILLGRYLVPLRRWAHGRLPPTSRSLVETQDLVQVTLLRALKQLDRFEPRREGAFLAYLRQILMNEIRALARAAARKPRRAPLDDHLATHGPSPLDQAIGKEMRRAYELALNSLTHEERDAVILRLELGFTHQQVAEALGKPSADAARMLVTRAVVRLTERMET